MGMSSAYKTDESAGEAGDADADSGPTKFPFGVATAGAITTRANRKQMMAPLKPPTHMPPPPPPQQQGGGRKRNESAGTATGIYVISGGGGGGAGGAVDERSNPATFDRRQQNRQSWLNMRRHAGDADDMPPPDSAHRSSGGAALAVVLPVPVTPSPQTTRSFISNSSTAGTSDGGGGAGGRSLGGGGGGEGTLSGRTTATSGRMSSSGVATTISGSNHTLNDIMGDFNPTAALSAAALMTTTTTSAMTTTAGVGATNNTLGRNTDDYRRRHLSDATTNASSLGTPSSTSPMKNGSFNLANGSTAKLLPNTDDEANQQTKCSVFRGIVLCVCLNVTYANVVRFPRELDRYGSAYLVPYIILLFLVGLPIVLLEVSVGQFLGQGAAHTWRASPIFKGACIISRFASWLSTVWVSLQGVLALAYICMLLFNTLPFSECVGNIKMSLSGYTVIGNSGQDCLLKTFLMPFWENPLYFGLLSIGLIGIWLVAMLCTHNGRILRRSLFCLGLLGLTLLCALTGWEVYNSLLREYFPQLWPFEQGQLYESNIWFSALMQVIFATNGGFGVLPMVTGKFLYKGDAVRTSVVYLCFNLLINAIAVTLFMVQFQYSVNGGSLIDELKPLTAVYDRVINGEIAANTIMARVVPSLIYALVLITALISVMVAVYTSTRLVPRHPNYVIGLIALVVTIIALSAPNFAVARILDARIVGTLAITALVFELIAITWIYGAKNIYTDLEFSIGRPIFHGWMVLWCICPAILTGVLVWWCSDDDLYDLMAEYVPRWAPILFALAVIFLIACVQIFRQVEYNFFGMICEASKSAKEWGPADPLARHSWKQWRSVCQDTGRRDFTLRRRGTRDYTHSIKKGQYSTANNKFAQSQQNQSQTNWKSSTPGNSSPNYSGSMFGDSAIEEDISVDKFPGVTQQFVPFQLNDGKPLRYSQRSRPQQRIGVHQQISAQHAEHQLQQDHLDQRLEEPLAPLGQQQQQLHHTVAYQAASQALRHNHEHANAFVAPPITERGGHREIVYIRRMSDDGQHATRIEITPSNESITYGAAGGGNSRNPLGRSGGIITTTTVNGGIPHGHGHGHGAAYVKRSASSSVIDHHHKRSSVISVGGGGAAAVGSGGAIHTGRLPPTTAHIGGSGDHICWRKYGRNPEEYSTEL